MQDVTLVTGGASSGKTAYALSLASGHRGKKAYIATAEARDDEMRAKIERHKAERGADWDTIEEPLTLPDAIQKASEDHSVVLVDCLTLWLTNLLLKGLDPKEASGLLSRALAEGKANASIVVVTNEVGMGIVPADAFTRRFRDEAGRLNRAVAEIADSVYVTISGFPMKLK